MQKWRVVRVENHSGTHFEIEVETTDSDVRGDSWTVWQVVPGKHFHSQAEAVEFGRAKFSTPKRTTVYES